ncbi:hypothetical protein NKDENANG_03483 [Candidatus Entotheonellaceae bacterium PAL068K]
MLDRALVDKTDLRLLGSGAVRLQLQPERGGEADEEAGGLALLEAQVRRGKGGDNDYEMETEVHSGSDLQWFSGRPVLDRRCLDRGSNAVAYQRHLRDLTAERQGRLCPTDDAAEAERARATHHLTTFGGDLLSPSVMSSLKQGAQMIELMNAIGIDVAGLGNHEFDFGDNVLKQRLAESRFTWLATNTLGPDGKPFGSLGATMLRQVGDLSIGFFAILTPDTRYLSDPGPSVTFAPVRQTAAAVKELKKQGADVIIAITHLNIAEERELARQVNLCCRRNISISARSLDLTRIWLCCGCSRW